MAIVKVVDEEYCCKKSIRNLIGYATNENKTHHYIGAIGTNAYEPEKMIQQMMAVKKGFDKVKGYRQARHLLVSFEDEAKITPDMACFIAYDIARYYSDRYQICFGVHLNTDNIHIHFIQNTVSYVDGKLFSGGSWELQKFKYYVNSVIFGYRVAGLNPVQVLDEYF